MSARFAEIDWRPTPLGVISLRRSRDPVSGADVYEVKLDDDFLMSSLFTEGEVALARLGLAALPRTAGPDAAAGPDGAEEPDAAAGLDVAVGGLGLGYTADEALKDERVGSLVVVEALGDVISWHEQGLVPLGTRLTSDPRCRFVHGDFFALAQDPSGLDPEAPGRRFHAILLDIDHSPSHVLHPGNARLYAPAGLRALAAKLHPGGVFALWSNDPPEDGFRAALAEVFQETEAHVVSFHNPLQGGHSTNTVYVARTAAV